MKNTFKMLALMIMSVVSVSAVDLTGWFNDFITVEGTTYYIGTNPGSGTQLDGASLPGVTSLKITAADMKYWGDGGDRTGGAFYWQVTSSDGNTVISGPTEVIWTHSSIGGNDARGTWSGSIDLLQGLSGGTSYQLHIWAKSWGSSNGDSWLSNLGANYVADFSTDASLPVELSAFNANNSARGVQLNWATDSEVENQGFIISRKTASTRWTELASFANVKALEGHGSTTQANRYTFTDAQVREGQTYSYMLSDVDYRGNRVNHDRFVQEITYVTPEESTRPALIALTKLYPNPFNPVTTLSYDLSEVADVSVNVYSMTGELIWTAAQKNQAAGVNHQLTWQGVDSQGKAVNSGIYLVSIQAGSQRLSQKVTLLR